MSPVIQILADRVKSARLKKAMDPTDKMAIREVPECNQESFLVNAKHRAIVANLGVNWLV